MMKSPAPVQRHNTKLSELQQEDLIRQYVPLIRRVVGRISRHLMRGDDQLELFEYGVMGFVKALETYEFDDSVSFSEYAEKHIREYILKVLRKEKPRYQYAEKKKLMEITRVKRYLAASLGRPPEEHDIAKKMGLRIEELRMLMVKAKPVEVLNFNEIAEAVLESPDPDDVPAVPISGGRVTEVIEFEGTDPLTFLLDNESSRLIEIALNRLPYEQRECVKLSFYDNQTPLEIATRFGITEREVSELRTAGLRKLRHYLMLHH